MKKYRYVIIACNGASYDLSREENFFPYGLGSKMHYDLPELLERGWRPVRETPMGGTGDTPMAYSLVLLEKDAADSSAPIVEAVKA
jgi:hypothetical protein